MAIGVPAPLSSPAPATRLSVPPPPLEDYVPQAGDQWAVAVLRPGDVDVVAPAGWTRMDTMRDVEVDGLVGDATIFHRTLGAHEGFDPVVFHLARATWARAVLQAYRPGVATLLGHPIGGLRPVGEWPTELEG